MRPSRSSTRWDTGRLGSWYGYWASWAGACGASASAAIAPATAATPMARLVDPRADIRCSLSRCGSAGAALPATGRSLSRSGPSSDRDGTGWAQLEDCGALRRGTCRSMAICAQVESYRHEALFYAGPDELMERTVPFVTDAVEAGEPILVVLGAAKIAALREALNGHREGVLYA